MKKTIESKYPPLDKNVLWLDASGDVKYLKCYINGDWQIVGDDSDNNKKLQDEIDDINEILPTKSDKSNTYTKADTNDLLSKKADVDVVNTKANIDSVYSKTEMDSMLKALNHLDYKVVDALPTTDISATTIYLKKISSSTETNNYEEYLYVNNSWELIGTTAIDLTPYTKTWVGTQAEYDALGTYEKNTVYFITK